METLRHTDDSTRELFATMFKKRNVLPIIGAGFTKGQKAPNATVPDGSQFQNIMLEAIMANEPSRNVTRIASKQFHGIAEYFMNVKFVTSDERKRIIKKYFTEIILDSDRQQFLKADWPYIYTLNIDDAIESNSRYRFTVLPYLNISQIAKVIAQSPGVTRQLEWGCRRA